MRFNPDAQLDTGHFVTHRPTADLGARIVADSTTDFIVQLIASSALVVLLAVAIVMIAFALRPRHNHG